MSRSTLQDKRAYLKTLARGGDMIAAILIDMLQEVSTKIGPVQSKVIRLTGQLTNGIGTPVNAAVPVLITSLTTVGPISITVVTGTAKLGNASDSIWLTSLPNGSFSVDVENAVVGDLSLLEIMTSDGIANIIQLQF